MPFGYRHGGFMHDFSGNGPGIFAIVMFVVFWVAVALLIALLVQYYRRGPSHLHHGPGLTPGAAGSAGTADPAVGILKERFAKGEVSEEEYSRRLALLKDG